MSSYLLPLMIDGGDGEGAGAVSGGEAVLRQWTGTPTVDTAHAAVFAVKRQEEERGMLFEF